MKRASTMLLCLAAIGLGCGGEADQVPGPATPPPPTAAPTVSATATATATAVATTPPPAPKPPLAELQKNAMKAMVAAFAAHDAKKVAELYAEDTVTGAPGSAGWTEEKGRASVEAGHAGLFAAFPDMKWATSRIFMKGDVVIQEWVSNATHKESGKPTGLQGVSVYWFNEDGLIKKDNTYYDAATIGAQTGASKAKARGIPKMPEGEPAAIVPTGSADEAKLVDATKALYGMTEKKATKEYLDMLSKDVVISAVFQPEDVKGQKGAKTGFEQMLKAFPDAKIAPSNVWAFGDLAVAEAEMTGTNNGPFGGAKATKKPVKLHMLEVVKYKDGKVLSVQSYGSTLELLGQLGMLEAPKKADPKPTPKKTK